MGFNNQTTGKITLNMKELLFLQDINSGESFTLKHQMYAYLYRIGI